MGREEAYFVKEHSDSKNKYSEDDIIKILEFLVDTIFVVCTGKDFSADSRYANGNKFCATLLADKFFSTHMKQNFTVPTGRKQLASLFNFTYRYIDDVLSINNPGFENYLGQMYPVELEIKDTTGSNTCISYLDLLLSIGRDDQLHTSIYDKRDDFNFHIQIFRSWVAIFQPRPPMGSLFRSLYDMPELAPRMDVLSSGRRDFQISFSNRDTSRNA